MNNKFKLPCMFHVLMIVIGLTTTSVFGLTPDPVFYPQIFENKAAAGIRTVLLHNSSWEFSLPVIEITRNQQLELRFDDLSAQPKNFGYTLVHCDAQWQASELEPQEYLSGFGQGTIREYTASFNTTYDYMHYHLLFPEEDCYPLLSGNYALLVYNEDEPDSILLIRRFYVTERTVDIEAHVRQPLYGKFKEARQQVLFSVLTHELDLHDPVTDLSIVVKQNNRPDNLLIMNKPYAVSPEKIEYTHPEQGVFEGGNEFRSLDIKSMKYQTENLASIDFRNPYYHVFMKADERRNHKPYFSKTDLNGDFFIDCEKTGDKHTGADYVYVHFKLQLPLNYALEDIYVTGGFCDWLSDQHNKMLFNEETGCFEVTLLLKQGLYDYCFFMAGSESKTLNEYELEGSYYETENDYSLFVYYHDRQLGYDRLAGFLSMK